MLTEPTVFALIPEQYCQQAAYCFAEDLSGDNTLRGSHEPELPLVSSWACIHECVHTHTLLYNLFLRHKTKISR